MKHLNIYDTIDIQNRDFSILVINPKPNLLEWLTTFSKKKGLDKYRLYIPEENAVLIIPKVDRFSTIIGSFDEFVDEVKPNLLRAELDRFGATPEDFGYPMTKASFDAFYEISVRDSVMFLSDFK